MAYLNLFVVLITSVLINVAIGTCSRSFGKYVVTPFGSQIGLDFDQNPFARALFRAESIMEDSPLPAILLVRLQEYVARLPNQDKADELPLRQLIELANGDDECGLDLPRWFILKYRIIESSRTIEKPEVVLDYMLHYGAEKFHKCALKTRIELKKKIDMNEVLDEVGIFFRRAVALSDHAANYELYNELRSIEATTARWNVDMLSRMGKTKGKKSQIGKLFYQQCARLELNFGPELDIIGLAANLNSDEDYAGSDADLLQLFEIRRICLERLSNHVSFEENLIKQRL